MPAIFAEGRPFELKTVALADYDLELTSGGALVSGAVLDATGGGVPGARLRLHFGRGWPEAERPFEQRAVADENGMFSAWVAPGPVGILAEADGYAGASTIEYAPSSDLRLILTPSARLSGTVVSSLDGEPVEGVVVTAKGLIWHRKDTSDGEGAFTIEGLHPGTYGLEASGPGWLGRPSGTVTLDLGEDRKGVVVAVSRGVRISGMVLVGDKPCRASALQLDPAPGETAPRLDVFGGPSGHVELEAVPPGRYVPSVTCHGYEPSVRDPIDVASADIAGLVWRVKAGTTLRVKAVTPEGKSAAEVGLVLDPRASSNKREQVFARTMNTDSEGIGTFLGVAPGEYVLNSAPNGQPRDVSVPAVASLDVTLTVAPVGSIDVVVRDDQGRPNDRVTVSAEPAEKDKRLLGDIGHGRGDGLHHIGPLAAGAYRVDVRDRSNPTKLINDGRPVVVRSGETSVVDVTYGGEGGQISGRVLDPQGNPLADVWVSATHASPQPDPYRHFVLELQETRTLTDVEGQFTLRELARDSTFTIVASHSLGGNARSKEVRVGAQVELALSAPGAVRGVVRTKDGRPPPYFKITVMNQAQEQMLYAAFSPDAEGRFLIEHVAAGAIEIAAHTPSGVGQISHTLVPGQTLGGVVLEIAPPEFTQTAAPAPARPGPDITRPVPGAEGAQTEPSRAGSAP